MADADLKRDFFPKHVRKELEETGKNSSRQEGYDGGVYYIYTPPPSTLPPSRGTAGKEVFEARESWMHQVGKELLAGWMIDRVIEFRSPDGDSWSNGQRRDTGWVCLWEYPINTETDQIFRDEVCSGGMIEERMCREGRCACWDCPHSEPFRPWRAVLDIAWGWKGQMEAAIEVMYTHEVPEEKVMLINAVGLVFVEVRAEEIMHHDASGIPPVLKARRIVYPHEEHRG